MPDHTILFVDDEANILRAISRLLRHEPLNVLTASGSDEALALLEDHPTQVVVSDQRMPDMNGADLLAMVRERHPDVVRMMLTGYTEMDVAVEARPSPTTFESTCSGAPWWKRRRFSVFPRVSWSAPVKRVRYKSTNSLGSGTSSSEPCAGGVDIEPVFGHSGRRLDQSRWRCASAI